MTKTSCTKIGPRDIEILTAIDRSPLTPAQLCRLSESFAQPFSDQHNLRRRLRKLTTAGYLLSFPYAAAGEGRSPSYFKLTRDGYRLLYGQDAKLPRRRYFQAISPGHHHHTNCLSETIVHLCVMASRNNCEVLHLARENSVKLEAQPFTLYPDCAFVVRRPDGRTFSFMVEVDNGTERVRSKQDVESIERKLRGYDAHQSQFDKFDPDRYIVIFVTTRSDYRLQHILSVASTVMAQPKRCVFAGCCLGDLLAVDPFRDAVFADNRGLHRQLIPIPAVDQKEFHQRKKSASFVPKSFTQVVF